MQPQTRLTEDERTNLVAFLDGELDEAEVQKLEEKVARSISVRKEVEALEKTWNMLDWLPRPEAAPDFTDQTISRIHSQQLRTELVEERVKVWSGVVLKIVAWAACVLAMATAGFVSLRHAWSDPSRDLIQLLPVIENLETYRAIPDLKFLDDISRLGMFTEPATATSGELPTEEAGQTQEGESGRGGEGERSRGGRRDKESEVRNQRSEVSSP